MSAANERAGENRYEVWSRDVATERLRTKGPFPDVVVIWGLDSEVSKAEIARFQASHDDAWTAALTGVDTPDLLRYTEPLQVYRLVPDPDVANAVTWRLDARCTFLRGSTLEALGGTEAGFASLDGALREMGQRWFSSGAIMRQRPEIAVLPMPAIPLEDRYRAIRLLRSPIWGRYALARRLSELAPPVEELRAYRRAIAGGPRTVKLTRLPPRDLKNGEVPPANVTIVLPTFGRYRYVAEVLEDIRAQTVKPTQILIADGNAPEDRQPDVYERFSDLPIEVLWITTPGICVPRNECLARATGDHVWFVDDDSRFAEDNLEAHLRVMREYGADVSVGPAYTRGRPELYPDQSLVRCSWMDCGTTLVRQDLLSRVGGFDLQFGDRLLGEDGELGIRMIRAGGLMVSNPHAKRFHYVAPVGGSRTSSHNIHRWKRLSLHPRPNQSIFYTGLRHFEVPAALEAVVQTWLVLGWRKPEGFVATNSWRVKTLASELAALPVSLARLAKSLYIGARMAREGAKIPELAHNPSAKQP